jgi:hypothetical protein
VKIGEVKVIILLTARRDFARDLYMFVPIRIKFGTDDAHKTLLRDVFRENRFIKSHILLRGINEFVFVISTSVIGFGLNSVQEICS